MKILVYVLVFAAILVGPVMIAARMIGASRTSFGAALLAVILAGLMSSAAESASPNDLIAAVASIGTGTLAYSYALGASLLGGFVISVISTGIQLVMLIPLLSMVVAAGA